MKTKVCFWATTFQADNLALACHLAQQDDFEVVVAMDRPEAYRAEPVTRVLPFPGKLVERRVWSTSRELAAFDADIVVVDNHLPPYRVAPRMLVLWHGFGWRVDDLRSMRKGLVDHVGDVTRPNDRFVWQAFGEWDRLYRIEHSRIAPENVRALGSAYSDLLLPSSPLASTFDAASVAGAYTIDVVGQKTVLLGLTWHHGGALGHWGDDSALTARLLDHIGSKGANALVRLHDRERYEPAYVARIESAVAERPWAQLKLKSDHPDSLVDLLVSEVMVSNYSSFLNAFYYTHRPTVHVDPADAGAPVVYRELRGGRVQERAVGSAREIWKLDPSENGGLRARSFDELLECIDRALADPLCCAQRSRAFVTRYIFGADGTTCPRIADLLRDW